MGDLWHEASQVTKTRAGQGGVMCCNAMSDAGAHMLRAESPPAYSSLDNESGAAYYYAKCAGLAYYVLGGLAAAVASLTLTLLAFGGALRARRPALEPPHMM